MARKQQKPRIRKHYNQKKLMKKLFGKTILWSWESDIDTDGQRMAYGQAFAGGGWRDIGPDLVHPALKQYFNWAVSVRVLCLYPDGKSKMLTAQLSAKDIRINDLIDAFAEIKRELIDGQQLAHIVDVGWIARTWTTTDPIDSDDWINMHVGPINKLRQQVWHTSEEYKQLINERNLEQAA